MAKLPVASPGPRIGQGLGWLRRAKRCETDTFGHEYRLRLWLPEGSVYSTSGEELVSVSWRNAQSRPSPEEPSA